MAQDTNPGHKPLARIRMKKILSVIALATMLTVANAQTTPATQPTTPAAQVAPAKSDTVPVIKARLKQYELQQKEASKLAKLQTKLQIEQLNYQNAITKGSKKVAIEQAKQK